MLRRARAAFVLAIGLVLSVASSTWAQASIHLALGNPSNAQTDKANPDEENYLMDKGIFALSYNSKKGTANWVSWRLVKEDFGDAKRKEGFHSDGELPAGFRKVSKEDYANSGFDRGHMCPDADRDADPKHQRQTYVMTNMVPQSHALNGGSWSQLEDHCRGLAKSGKELYIIAGPWGKGGTGKIDKPGTANDQVVSRETLAGGSITVPSHCWKVILVLEPGPEAASQRVTKDSHLIAVFLANDLAPKKWDAHPVSVAEIETRTGLKFFTNVPAAVREALVQRVPVRDIVAQPHAAPAPRLAQPRRVGPLRGILNLRPGLLLNRRFR